jgi:plastocyanin
MWVASDQHPTHTEYSGTSRTEHCQNGDQTSSAFDQCSAGDNFSFTFEQEGEWSYHNHENSFQGGTVVVE